MKKRRRKGRMEDEEGTYVDIDNRFTAKQDHVYYSAHYIEDVLGCLKCRAGVVQLVNLEKC